MTDERALGVCSRLPVRPGARPKRVGVLPAHSGVVARGPSHPRRGVAPSWRGVRCQEMWASDARGFGRASSPAILAPSWRPGPPPRRILPTARVLRSNALYMPHNTSHPPTHTGEGGFPCLR